ncbi:MAG TPA: phosphoribosylaminoimidazolesuccinocarboxamide synthase [Phycisphaerales bacterium]|nr:phosphoribosylaminoimidazolesuccinocarboxamide synthase [Phycisphaerales bacterium]
MQGLFESHLNLPGPRRGKVRDVYELPGDSDRLLIVATDRISAFDVVMPTPIPGKGRVLTRLSTFWLHFIEQAGLCRTHLISDDVGQLPDSAFGIGGTGRAELAGRVMIARRARVVPIECVVRGYLEGSGWKEYQATGAVCGVKLPAGLRQCDKLPQPIFTPATKEEQGKHDENITFDDACSRVGRLLMERLRDTSLAIYSKAAEHAAARGIIIADTKFEFGLTTEPDSESRATEPMLIDEALTPDSSRFWPASDYQPGRAQRSFDKQYLREYLETLVAKGEWNKQAPGPALPDQIAQATLAKYEEAAERLMR